MGIKRRAFLIGGASVVGGGLFALHWMNGSAVSKGGQMLDQDRSRRHNHTLFAAH
jgi:hypothetical protein